MYSENDIIDNVKFNNILNEEQLSEVEFKKKRILYI